MPTKSIGEYMHQFRKDRGLTLNEAVAESGCSAAALSRFERGVSDISVTSMQRIITNLQFTAHDFFNYNQSRTDALTRNTLFAFIKDDQDFLAMNLANFMTTNSQFLNSRPLSFVHFLLTTTKRTDYSAYRLTAAEEDAISDFVVPSPAWNETQSLALASALRFGSNELSDQLTQRLIKYTTQFTAENITEAVIESSDFAYLLINTMIHRNLTTSAQLCTAMTAYHELRAHHNQPDQISNSVINSAPLVYFSEAAFAWLQQASPSNEAHVLHVITQIRDLSVTGLANYLERIWPLIKAGQHGWHNYQLKDLHPTQQPFDMQNWRFSGANISMLRKFYHLTLADVSVNWQPATQSRFENGKSKLGFTDSLRLLNVLLLRPSFFYQAVFPIPFSDFKKLVYQTDIADKRERINQAYRTTLSNLPQKPENRYQAMQAELRFRVVQSLYEFQYDIDHLDSEFSEEEIQRLALAGLYATKHMQYSDLITFINTASSIDPPELIAALHWAVAHYRGDTQNSSPMIEVFSILVRNLAQTGEGEDIIKLNRFLDNSDYNRVETTIGSSFSFAELMIALYTHPEQAPQIKAQISRNRQTMLEFAQPINPKGAWIGAAFEDMIELMLQRADAWVATRSI